MLSVILLWLKIHSLAVVLWGKELTNMVATDNSCFYCTITIKICVRIQEKFVYDYKKSLCTIARKICVRIQEKFVHDYKTSLCTIIRKVCVRLQENLCTITRKVCVRL